MFIPSESDRKSSQYFQAFSKSLKMIHFLTSAALSTSTL
jgi:hypothetical protein